MRIISTINPALTDEHVIGIDPPLQPSLPSVWRRRINPFIGRALSGAAMTAAQEHDAGMLRVRGQAMTAGVVNGLDVMPEPGAITAAAGQAVLQILPGLALARSGEDVIVSSARRITLGDLQIHARSDQLNAIAGGQPGGGTVDDTGLAWLKPAVPRRIGPSLASVIPVAAAAALPWLAVLVAQPVTASMLGRPAGSCPLDQRDAAFEDQQRIDGCRLLLSFWPSERLTTVAGRADYELPPIGPNRRNRAAFDIFDVEAIMATDDMHPWEIVGVPLALIGFKADWTLDFIDTSSVVRLGGQRLARTAAVHGAGTPVLWQARMRQFVEHMGDLPDLTPATLTAAFRRLPPIGFVPASLIDLPGRVQHLFPPGMTIAARPMPTEDLDAVVQDSSALAPIDPWAMDQVELLVPVPDRVYDPGLLLTASVDAAFDRTIAKFTATRTDWLIRRELVRRRRDLAHAMIAGTTESWRADLSTAEALPQPQTRGPVTATQIRHVPATGLRILKMFAAATQLAFAQGDRVFVWIRIVDATGLTGVSVRFGTGTKIDGTGDFSSGVFWGVAPTPIAAGDNNIASRRAGDLPAAGSWTRLLVAANARWTAAGASLSGAPVAGVLVGGAPAGATPAIVADGLELAQTGGTVEWGPVGHISSDGQETVWVADDAPPGAVLQDNSTPTPTAPTTTTPGWPQAPAGTETPVIEDDFGTAATGGVRTSTAITAFRARWTQSFLVDDLASLESAGLDAFISGSTRRLNATNDLIDLGFVRAQANIYRVRQLVLGADVAARLVTSPTLADLANRDASARATAVDLESYLKTSYETSPARDPNMPLQTKIVQAPTTPASPTTPTSSTSPAPSAPVRSVFLESASFVSQTISQPSAVQRLMTSTTFVTSGTRSVEIAPRTTTLADTSDSVIALRASATRSVDDVRHQLPLTGAVERTVSVAERLKPSPVVEAHQAALAGKLEVMQTVAALIGDQTSGTRPPGIVVADIQVPGYALKAGQTVPAPRIAGSAGDIVADSRKAPANQQYTDLDQVTAADSWHEAEYFRASAAAIDNVVAFMRLIEGRAALYQQLLDDAKATRAAVATSAGAASTRLTAIDVGLEEARQDVGMAIALRAEEQARVDALNAQRSAILAANVRMIVFRRPRATPHIRVAASAPAASALTESPILACTRSHPAVPEVLREYVGTLRLGPVFWFPPVAQAVSLIDRLDAARAALLGIQFRATAAKPVFTAAAPTRGTKLMVAAYQVVTLARTSVDTIRPMAAALDVGAISSAGLAAVHQTIRQIASLDDLIVADHNRPVLARQAAALIEQIGEAAACLHASFADVPPVSRLAWGTLLSEFATPVPLAQLSSLPGWNDLPIDTRRTQQGLVDWLFGQINRSNASAVNGVNDLVRVCILLAADAPVDRIIAAHLMAPAPSQIGGRIHVAVDERVVRTGMTALIRDAAQQPIAHAIVDDLDQGVAHARIVQTFQSLTSIPDTAGVELTDMEVTASDA
jgi:hypothetical protein